MLGSIFWIEGRNGRSKWWIIQTIATTFAAIVWFRYIPTEGLIYLANSGAGTALPEQASATTIADNFEMLDNFITFAGLPIWWLAWVNNVRRYHDVNKSGWWALNTFIPLVGNAWQIAQLGFKPGDMETNDYGPSPGSFTAGHSGAEDGSPVSGVLAKVDDNYLAEYARRYAAEQAALAKPTAIATQTGFGAATVGGGSFGKRR